MDVVDSSASLLSAAASLDGHDIELKTEVENPKPTERLVAKYAKWWLQCRLVDVSEIIVGVKEKPHGGLPSVVKTLKSIDVERLPRMANGQRYWKPNDMVCSYVSMLC